MIAVFVKVQLIACSMSLRLLNQYEDFEPSRSYLERPVPTHFWLHPVTINNFEWLRLAEVGDYMLSYCIHTAVVCILGHGV